MWQAKQEKQDCFESLCDGTSCACAGSKKCAAKKRAKGVFLLKGKKGVADCREVVVELKLQEVVSGSI